ncbi:MAG: hypothetical protein HUU15_16465, partial [Candidatus Brocadiae bacterium]|nr:hypothetical protein [Candidatus Brocadiia bacterium]
RHWASPGSPPTVSVAGRDSLPVRRALEAVGLVPVAGGADPRIWVGEVPSSPPRSPAILIDPARGVPGLFEFDGVTEAPALRIGEATDPLIRAAAAADLDRLTVLRSARLRFLRPHRTLVDPVLFDSDGVLVFAFDPAPPNSNFSRLVAFPLLWAEAARRLHPAPRRTLPTGGSISGQVLVQSGLVVRDGVVWAVNIEDPDELAPPDATPAAPTLDLPSRTVIRSRSTLPPTVAAIAGLSLLILSWLVSRTRP